MIIITAAQGSEEWIAIRPQFCCASDAAAMLGVSSKVPRSELLHMRATAGAREFSEWAQKNLLDKGHDVEALARPIAEKIIGDDLYPVTGWDEIDGLRLLASFDGITADETRGWENKLLNKELLACMELGELPADYWPQLEHQLLVSGAEAIYFTVSNGAEANTRAMRYESVPERRAQIIGGWKQFLADLADYKPVEVIPAAVAEPTLDLPVPSIQINGSLALTSNLEVFGTRLRSFIDGLNPKPETDQDFADAEAAVKTLEKAEKALVAAEDMGMAQVASVEEMRRLVKLYRDQARITRLAVEKLVKARKEQIRVEIHAAAKAALDSHVASLNERMGYPFMPAQVADFASAMRSKRTITSLRDAVDAELARAKIEASRVADIIQINVRAFEDQAKVKGYAVLFPDLRQIVHKEREDFINLMKSRIAEHVAAEEKRLEAERDRIRQEEAAKAAAEQRAREEAAQRQREAEDRARAETEARERRERDEAARRETEQREREQAEERGRLQAQLDAERAARVEAERRAAKPAEAPTARGVSIPDIPGRDPAPRQASKPSALDRPADDQIIKVLSLHFRVHESKVLEWLLDMDLTVASERMVANI